MPTLLSEAITPTNLALAWQAVEANQGVAGVDDVAILAWGRNWQERLVRLEGEVRRGVYYPKKLRQRRIPKKGSGGYRTLRIPTVTDRVLQRAVLEVLYPVFEPRFLACSFGYRPGRGVEDAVTRLMVLRENDKRWVLDADIDDFFDNVDHELLWSFLEEDLPDASLMPLLDGWLRMGRTRLEPPTGIPLGSPLSPLLANVLLHRLDLAVQDMGYNLVRYADDFVVLCNSLDALHAAYQNIHECLDGLKLRYEPTKTRLTSFEKGFLFLGVWFLGDTIEYTWENQRIVVTPPAEPDFNAYPLPPGYSS